MAKASANVIDEIVSLIPQNQSSLPWWRKLTPEQAQAVDAIREGWLAGKFGTAKKPAAAGISKWLRQRGIEIGPQGVIAWLHTLRS